MSDICYLYCEYICNYNNGFSRYTEYFKLGKDNYHIYKRFAYTYITMNYGYTSFTFQIQKYDDLQHNNRSDVIEIYKIHFDKNHKNIYDTFQYHNNKTFKFIEMKKFCDNIINTNKVLDKPDIDCSDRYEFANDGKNLLIKLLNPNYK